MLIERKLVRLDLEPKGKVELIKELGDLAFSLGKIKSIDGYMDAVIKRENEFSTAIGYSIAIPHGKSDDVLEPFIVFGRVREDVKWDEESSNEVKLIFLIGVPKNQSGDIHLKILANISRKLIDDDFRNRLITANSTEEVYFTLQAVAV
jgi:fructose-specific phosphotransferase system IIA component